MDKNQFSALMTNENKQILNALTESVNPRVVDIAFNSTSDFFDCAEFTIVTFIDETENAYKLSLGYLLASFAYLKKNNYFIIELLVYARLNLGNRSNLTQVLRLLNLLAFN